MADSVVLQAMPAPAVALVAGRRVRAFIGGALRLEIEYLAIVRSREVRIQPDEQLVIAAQRRHSFVSHRGEHRASDEDLAPHVALAVRLARTGNEATSLSAKPRERFVDGSEAGTDFSGWGMAFSR